jgi:hypothetical protein
VTGFGIGKVLAERGRGRKMGRAYRQHLEQRSHAGGRNEALGGGLDGAGTLGVGGHQPRRALGDAESAQKLGLGDGTIRGEARSPCLVGEGRELDVGGQIGGAWRGERVDVGVPAHGLERIAIGGLGRAVVDEEGDAGPCAPAQLGEHLVLAGPQREDGADRRCWRCSSMSRLVPDRETQRPRGVELNHTLAPAVLAEHELPDRQRVQELVGDDDGRAIRHLVHSGVPSDRRAVPLPLVGRG